MNGVWRSAGNEKWKASVLSSDTERHTEQKNSNHQSAIQSRIIFQRIMLESKKLIKRERKFTGFKVKLSDWKILINSES